METLQWTTIENTGYWRGIHGHVALPVSPKDILFVGGSEAGVVVDRLKIFDAEKLEWKEGAYLPDELIGRDGGLLYPEAIRFATQNGSIALCIGGYRDESCEDPSRYIVRFDIDTNGPLPQFR